MNYLKTQSLDPLIFSVFIHSLVCKVKTNSIVLLFLSKNNDSGRGNIVIWFKIQNKKLCGKMSFFHPWLSAIKFSSLKTTSCQSHIFFLKIMNIIAHNILSERHYGVVPKNLDYGARLPVIIFCLCQLLAM